MIPTLRACAVEERKRIRALDAYRDGRVYYANNASRWDRIVRFLELGLRVERYHHLGLLLDGKVVVGTQKKRWRLAKCGGGGRWHSYKTEEWLAAQVKEIQ